MKIGKVSGSQLSDEDMGQKPGRGEDVPGKGLAVHRLGGMGKPMSPENFLVHQGSGEEAGQVGRDEDPLEVALEVGGSKKLGLFSRAAKHH